MNPDTLSSTQCDESSQLSARPMAGPSTLVVPVDLGRLDTEFAEDFASPMVRWVTVVVSMRMKSGCRGGRSPCRGGTCVQRCGVRLCLPESTDEADAEVLVRAFSVSRGTWCMQLAAEAHLEHAPVTLRA